MEVELVGASNHLSYNIWYVMFMYHQVYLNKSNKFFQYNQVIMRMELNGGNSFTGKLGILIAGSLN